MGKWNHRRRWVSRKNYNQPPPPSPPNYFDTEFKFRGYWKNTELPWEERFCLSVGIQWQKVVIAQRSMNYHDIVAKWNDSAGEEAFHNAKRRFWAQINNLPCDAPLPDPNAYVDEVDWNLDVNPDLMLEVDREYFNPDEAGKVNSSSGQGEMNPSTSANPWESSREASNGAVDDAEHTWGLWDKSRNLTSHNPWEDRNTRNDSPTKDNRWGPADNLWARTSGVTCAGSSERLENNPRNSWNQSAQIAGSVKQTGREYTGNNYSAWGNNDHGSRKFAPENKQRKDCTDHSSAWKQWGDNQNRASNNYSAWGNNDHGSRNCAPENKQWKDRRDSNSAWKQRDSNQNYTSNNLDHRWHTGGDWSRNGGCLKREGSQQYTSSRYKSSRVDTEDNGTEHQWKKQRNYNRVSFT